jgi:hypothetical protein
MQQYQATMVLQRPKDTAARQWEQVTVVHNNNQESFLSNNVLHDVA